MGTSLYTPELMDRICARLAEGEPLAQICRDPSIGVAARTVREWALDDPAIGAAIARARDLGADAIAEDALAIIDMPPAYKVTAEGQSIDQGDVQNRKLQFEGRLKLLAKWNPKRYGDKIEHEHKGNVALGLVINEKPKELAK